jgi:hypothetical protein
MTLDRRRADEAREKAKAARVLRSRGYAQEDDPKAVGKHYSTHGSDCSCMFCGNPRKFFDEKTLAERKQEIEDVDE